MKKRIVFTLALTIICLFQLAAQPGGGRRGGGFDPKEMVAREKEMVLAKVEGLSEDQILLLDGIYEEFGITVEETIAEVRKSGDFSQMRTKMPALREEKDLLIKDVLDEDQYTTYEALVSENRKKRQEAMKNRRNNPNNN